VIVILAFLMLNWPLNAGLKYLLLVPSAFAVIMGLYEFAIRRSRLLWLLFGMPAKREA
jgi:hypothetical protein